MEQKRKNKRVLEYLEALRTLNLELLHSQDGETSLKIIKEFTIKSSRLAAAAVKKRRLKLCTKLLDVLKLFILHANDKKKSNDICGDSFTDYVAALLSCFVDVRLNIENSASQPDSDICIELSMWLYLLLSDCKTKIIDVLLQLQISSDISCQFLKPILTHLISNSSLTSSPEAYIKLIILTNNWTSEKFSLETIQKRLSELSFPPGLFKWLRQIGATRFTKKFQQTKYLFNGERISPNFTSKDGNNVLDCLCKYRIDESAKPDFKSQDDVFMVDRRRSLVDDVEILDGSSSDDDGDGEENGVVSEPENERVDIMEVEEFKTRDGDESNDDVELMSEVDIPDFREGKVNTVKRDVKNVRKTSNLCLNIEENVSEVESNVSDSEENVTETEFDSSDVEENVEGEEFDVKTNEKTSNLSVDVQDNVSETDSDASDDEENVSEIDSDASDHGENVSESESDVSDDQENVEKLRLDVTANGKTSNFDVKNKKNQLQVNLNGNSVKNSDEKEKNLNVHVTSNQKTSNLNSQKQTNVKLDLTESSDEGDGIITEDDEDEHDMGDDASESSYEAPESIQLELSDDEIENVAKPKSGNSETTSRDKNESKMEDVEVESDFFETSGENLPTNEVPEKFTPNSSIGDESTEEYEDSPSSPTFDDKSTEEYENSSDNEDTSKNTSNKSIVVENDDKIDDVEDTSFPVRQFENSIPCSSTPFPENKQHVKQDTIVLDNDVTCASNVNDLTSETADNTSLCLKLSLDSTSAEKSPESIGVNVEKHHVIDECEKIEAPKKKPTVGSPEKRRTGNVTSISTKFARKTNNDVTTAKESAKRVVARKRKRFGVERTAMLVLSDDDETSSPEKNNDVKSPDRKKFIVDVTSPGDDKSQVLSLGSKIQKGLLNSPRVVLTPIDIKTYTVKLDVTNNKIASSSSSQISTPTEEATTPRKKLFTNTTRENDVYDVHSAPEFKTSIETENFPDKNSLEIDKNISSVNKHVTSLSKVLRQSDDVVMNQQRIKISPQKEENVIVDVSTSSAIAQKLSHVTSPALQNSSPLKGQRIQLNYLPSDSSSENTQVGISSVTSPAGKSTSSSDDLFKTPKSTRVNTSSRNKTKSHTVQENKNDNDGTPKNTSSRVLRNRLSYKLTATPRRSLRINSSKKDVESSDDQKRDESTSGSDTEEKDVTDDVSRITHRRRARETTTRKCPPRQCKQHTSYDDPFSKQRKSKRQVNKIVVPPDNDDFSSNRKQFRIILTGNIADIYKDNPKGDIVIYKPNIHKMSPKKALKIVREALDEEVGSLVSEIVSDSDDGTKITFKLPNLEQYEVMSSPEVDAL